MCNLLEEEEEEKKKKTIVAQPSINVAIAKLLKKYIYILLCLLNLAKMTPIAALKMQLQVKDLYQRF